MAEIIKSPHKNHRQRLKEKVKNHGLGCLAEHEVLEFLLTYIIPRKDTNPIAHDLIDYFGSFSKVIDANYYDLQKIDGIGPEAALFINALSSFMEEYNKSKLESKVSILNSTTKCVDFFREFYRIKNNEFMIMACLSKNKRVVKTFRYQGKDETEITFDLRQIANNINDIGVNSVVLYHTHPNGSVQPSVSDLTTTQNILNICMFNGIEFEDHIILNETEHFSFNKNHIIDEMKNKYKIICSIADTYNGTFKNEEGNKNKPS